MRKVKGFALVQAIFFMMFIAAAVSVSMIVKVNDHAKTKPAATAVEVFPVVEGYLDYALALEDPNQADSQAYTDAYLSQSYVNDLKETEGFDPSQMSITVNVS